MLKNKHVIKYNQDIKKNIGIKCDMLVDFRIITETLTRIGICNKITKVMTPSCYIKRGARSAAICHFKELLYNIGYKKNMRNEDYNRRNSIATLLENWDLIKIKDRSKYIVNPTKIFVLKKKEKQHYFINHKFTF